MYTRRDFGKIMLAGVPLSMISLPEIKSAFKGYGSGSSPTVSGPCRSMTR
jgi:hypothetical protein